MPRRIVAFCILAAVLAAVFVRLGVWQLSRLHDRRLENDLLAYQLSKPEVPWAALGGPVRGWRRRAVVVGIPDTISEFVVTGRSRNGSPGVWIITPLNVPGSDKAVLVNRGWVYAPDARTADRSRWRERRTEYHGYTQLLNPGGAITGGGNSVRSLDSVAVGSVLPYAFESLFLVALDSGAIDSTPARLPMPVRDDGPHLSYAVQWFSFAVIALAGATVVARKAVTRDV